MAEGDTILRLARRLEAALGCEPVIPALRATPGRGQGDANRTAYWCPRCQS